MDIDIFIHRSLFSCVIALQGVPADLKGAAMPRVDRSLGAGEDVGIGDEQFGAEQLSCANQDLCAGS